jgi:hypothetical protein
VKARSGGSKAAGKGSKRQRRAPASQKQQQESAAEQQTEEAAAATSVEEAAAAVPDVEPVAAAAAEVVSKTAPANVRRQGPQSEKQQPQQKQQPGAEEETWQPAERVLADVTRQQLGVAVGRRATIATLRAGSGTAAAASGRDGMQQTAKGAGGTLTPVAFRTRHRHGR